MFIMVCTFSTITNIYFKYIYIIIISNYKLYIYIFITYNIWIEFNMRKKL